MNTAIGMVAAMVNVPKGSLSAAFTTTSAITASMMTMINSTVINAGKTRHLADLFPRHLPQRFAVTAHGGETG